MKQWRNGIGFALGGVVMTLLVIGGWRFYTGWRTGRVVLTTAREPVVVQVLAADSDTPIGEPVGLATRAVLSLPAGDYRLLVNGKGRLGRTYRFAVNRGESLAHSVSLDEGRLPGGEVAGGSAEDGEDVRGARDDGSDQSARRPRPAIPFARVISALELSAGKADWIEWTGKTLIRRDGSSGSVVWDLSDPDKQDVGGRSLLNLLSQRFDSRGFRAGIADSVPDLDRDGTGDAILFSRAAAGVVAVSGRDGSMLWNFFAKEDGGGGPLRDGFGFDLDLFKLRSASTAGVPTVTDVDGDGVPDLIATFRFYDIFQRNAGKWVLSAISGRSGRQLWTFVIETPAATSREGRPVMLVRSSRATLVAFVDGSEWTSLDAATGKRVAGPIDLGANPIAPVRHADLDGDGEPEVLALARGPGGTQLTLEAFSIKSGRAIWSATVDSGYQGREFGHAPRVYPHIANLNQDGRAFLVVPDSGTIAPRTRYWGVRLIDGRTGETRWRRPMGPQGSGDDGIAEVVIAPDLDGDGTHEVVTVSVCKAGNRQAIYVDALSGKDGNPLWWWKADSRKEETRIATPVWWGHGPDGWPLLVLPLGGEDLDDSDKLVESDPLAPPVVHLLEASTGRELHSVAGLERPGFADLDGDGLTDLWGDFEGELRAFRGETPEVWRALGRFERAGSRGGRGDVTATTEVDFDGDGVTDTLIGDVYAPGTEDDDATGGHTAIVRSGRDGHAIWKAVVDPVESWLRPNSGNAYVLSACPMPEGDFDRDGTPDVVVARTRGGSSAAARRGRPATLAVELFSGRTGSRVWSAGAFPPGPRVNANADIHWSDAVVVKPGGQPDLIVGRGGWAGFNLTRVSGDYGRIVWDTSIFNDSGGALVHGKPTRLWNDLDGDGVLDLLVLIPSVAGFASTSVRSVDHTLLAISLRDGKRLWSQALFDNFFSAGVVHVGDLDGDGRPEVVTLEEFSDRVGDRSDPRIRAFDGRDGKPLWTWRPNLGSSVMMAFANFDGSGKRSVCVSYGEPGKTRRIAVLDAEGNERLHREGVVDQGDGLTAADLDGDGRDELLLYYQGFLHAWDRELKDLWFWPARSGTIDRIIPPSPSRGLPGMVVLDGALALDGATGQPRWTGQAPLVEKPPQFLPRLLDPGDSRRGALLLTEGLGATVCRAALPTLADGSIVSLAGERIRARRVADDPRWARPLPWVRRLGDVLSPANLCASFGLALVNVYLPLFLVLRVLRKRRFFHIRALMLMPVAAAIPLMMYLSLVPWMPGYLNRMLSSETKVFVGGTLAGAPAVFYAGVMGACLLRQRWKKLGLLVVVTVSAAAWIAAVWIWLDRRSMASGLEHYASPGWELVVVLGVEMAAGLWGAGIVVLGGYRWMLRARVRRQG